MIKRHPKKNVVLKEPKNKAQYVKLFKKGSELHEKGQYQEALLYLTTAWKYDDKDVNLLIRVADSLFNINKKSAAMELMAHALQKNPSDPNIASILGNAALKMEFFDLSLKFHQHCINLKPNDPVGYNNYAAALRENGQYDEAISFLQDILPIFPQSEILWNTLGAVVAFRDGPGNAIVFYEECLKLNPDNHQALNNIAPAYDSIGQIEKAEKAARRAIKIKSDEKDPHIYLSSLLLNNKNMAEGWKEYHWRLIDSETIMTIKQHAVPLWNGECLKGKKIFIFGEQGIGDEILFTWLFDDLIKESDQVGIACEPRLVNLFKSSFPDAQVGRYEHKVVKKIDLNFLDFPEFTINEFDYVCPAGSIPMHKWNEYTKVTTSSSPILKPSNELINNWSKRVNELPNDISIGISWRSGIRLAKRARHYALLLDWAPILDQKNINLINLQYGDCEEELDEFEQTTGIKIHNFKDLDLKDDFEATTAMMKSLDLVMGPGSAPLMQAKMAGVETWVFTSGKPWWAFGEEVPIWRQNAKVVTKNENEPWPEFMVEKAKDFKKWLKSRRK